MLRSRRSDVLYDLAFPLMDFIRYGRQAEANTLLNRYLAVTASENLDALAALPLFMSLRSAIRAEVLLARLDRDARDNGDTMQSARAYFELARLTIASNGARAGRGRRAVGHRKIRPGARARAFAAAAAGSRGVAQRRPAQAAVQGQRNRSPARKRLRGGDFRADLRDPDRNAPFAFSRRAIRSWSMRYLPGKSERNAASRRRAQAKCPLYRAFS